MRSCSDALLFSISARIAVRARGFGNVVRARTAARCTRSSSDFISSSSAASASSPPTEPRNPVASARMSIDGSFFATLTSVAVADASFLFAIIQSARAAELDRALVLAAENLLRLRERLVGIGLAERVQRLGADGLVLVVARAAALGERALHEILVAKSARGEHAGDARGQRRIGVAAAATRPAGYLFLRGSRTASAS